MTGLAARVRLDRWNLPHANLSRAGPVPNPSETLKLDGAQLIDLLARRAFKC
jgi:hypothetical protein